MIVKIGKRLHDSMKESIGIRFTNNEMAMIVHNYIYKNPPECIMLLNGSRKNDNMDDAMKTSVESKLFLDELEKYLKKNNPKTYKPPTNLEVA